MYIYMLVCVCVCVLLKQNAESGRIYIYYIRYLYTMTMIRNEINGFDGKHGFASELITRRPKVDEKRFVSVVYTVLKIMIIFQNIYTLPAGPVRLVDRRY